MMKRRSTYFSAASAILLNVILGIIVAATLGCAAKAPGPSKIPQDNISEKKELPTQPLDQPATDKKRAPSPKVNPRAVASLHLTEQARMLLESHKIDEAIRVLEQAIMVNPSNGQNYYYLAEAWIAKGNAGKALEFNNLAGLYLKNDPKWIEKVMRQREFVKKAVK